MNPQVWQVRQVVALFESVDQDYEAEDRWQIWHQPSKTQLVILDDENLALRVVQRLETDSFPIPWERVREKSEAKVNRDQARHIIREEIEAC